MFTLRLQCDWAYGELKIVSNHHIVNTNISWLHASTNLLGNLKWILHIWKSLQRFKILSTDGGMDGQGEANTTRSTLLSEGNDNWFDQLWRHNLEGSGRPFLSQQPTLPRMMPSGNKPLPEAMLIQIYGFMLPWFSVREVYKYVFIWCYLR